MKGGKKRKEKERFKKRGKERKKEERKKGERQKEGKRERTKERKKHWSLLLLIPLHSMEHLGAFRHLCFLKERDQQSRLGIPALGKALGELLADSSLGSHQLHGAGKALGPA